MGCQVVRQTLDALKIMHASGRIHKDLKAENVMVDLPAPESPKGRANRHLVAPGSWNAGFLWRQFETPKPLWLVYC